MEVSNRDSKQCFSSSSESILNPTNSEIIQEPWTDQSKLRESRLFDSDTKAAQVVMRTALDSDKQLLQSIFIFQQQAKEKGRVHKDNWVFDSSDWWSPLHSSVQHSNQHHRETDMAIS